VGAPMPASGSATASASTNSPDARKKHWAFQPVSKPAPPTVKQSRWVRSPVDNFILSKLEQRNVKPAPAADKRTLIRRVTYDLIGLPPTPEEVDAFVCDQRPNAYSELVERLLASPQYGERWARYWLDVARYADTKGYLAGGEERRFPYSYTYRDYVIRAFKEDKPYDQFIIEQIAADLTPSKDKRSLAAMGFLTLGRRFLNVQNDIIDDRIDVVSRGMLGLTVACARCHDHKFDPIASKDYYAMHGIFASSEEPSEWPLLGEIDNSSKYQDYLKEKEKIEAEITGFKNHEVAQFLIELRQHVGDYLLGAHGAEGIEVSKLETFAGEQKLGPEVLRRWITELGVRSKKFDPILQPWFVLSKMGDAGDPSKSEFASVDDAQLNPAVSVAFAGWRTNSLKGLAAEYSRLFKSVEEEWQNTLAAAKKDNKPTPVGLSDPGREALRQVLYSENAAVNVPRAEAESILSRKIGEGIAPIRNRIEALAWTHPGAPARAMALVDKANPANSHVLLRGNPSNPGEEVPRRFVEILSPGGCAPYTNGSGRLELARAIANPRNPLTARVYVNRIWLHHFGAGLANSAGDFGLRTEVPIHRELLDYLAADFVEHGWSTKHLHRLLLLSSTYQQSTEADASALKADPDNRLLSRMSRQRLDFEALRDSLLALAGKLDPTVGGLPTDLLAEPFTCRRTIYGFIDRQNLPGVYRTFDFANPDTSNQGRFQTTVPQQALFLLNNPFVLQQARALAQRDEVKRSRDAAGQVTALYHIVYQRNPVASELKLAQKFMRAQPEISVGPSPLEKLGQILLLSNEAMFVD